MTACNSPASTAVNNLVRADEWVRPYTRTVGRPSRPDITLCDWRDSSKTCGNVDIVDGADVVRAAELAHLTTTGPLRRHRGWRLAKPTSVSRPAMLPR